jgi:hypothetical protein
VAYQAASRDWVGKNMTESENEELAQIKKRLKENDFVTYEEWERLVELEIKKEKEASCISGWQ